MKFSLDGRVLLFSLAVSLATSLAFGLAPAFGSSVVDLSSSLKEGGRAGSGGGRHKLLRSGLVVGEVALSVILLAGAGLTVRSFLALRAQNLGYNPQHVLSVDVDYPDQRYPDGPKEMCIRDRAHMAAAWIVMWHKRRTASPFGDSLFPALARLLGLQREVALLEFPRGGMPLSFGVLHPAVFLPADAREWSEERRRVVMLHELAHIRRGDLATQLIARAAVSLFWWNPLVWLSLIHI